MASSTIVKEFVKKTKTIQIEWFSLSNPTQSAYIDISKPGYTPYMIAGFNVFGEGASTVSLCSLLITDSKQLYYMCRMQGYTPSSLTQNGISIDIVYQRSS